MHITLTRVFRYSIADIRVNDTNLHSYRIGALLDHSRKT